MPYQNINVTLTPTQVADIKNAFNAAKTTPGLQPLSAKLAESFKRQGSQKPTVPPA